MKKNNVNVSDKAFAALKKRTAAEIKLLASFDECQAELFNRFVDAWMLYDDCRK